jgi:hypothetical protein
MNGNPLKTRWLLVVLVAAAGVACSSGGNGGDGGDDGGDGEITVLPRYEFQLTSNPETPIVVQVPMAEGTSLRLTHLGDGPGIFGDFIYETGAFSIFGGSSLVVEEVGLAPLFGDFDVQATQTWVIPVDEFATSGAMVVRRGAAQVFVTVLPAGAGVLVQWDENNDGTLESEVPLSWDEFDDLPDTAPEWQQLASFAYSATVDFMLELAEWSIAGIALIDDELVTLSPIVAPCDAFSGAGLAVPPSPPVIPDRGSLIFTWYDDAASGSVNPGDSFSMGFEYCWMDMTVFGDDYSALYNGLIGMNSWTEVVDNDILTRIGFEGTSPAGRAGGLVFENFEMWETWVDMGVTVAHRDAVVNGRLEVVFFAP